MIRQLKLESNQAEQLVYISPKHRATFHPFIFSLQKQGKMNLRRYWQRRVEQKGFTLRLGEQQTEIIYSKIPVSETYPGFQQTFSVHVAMVSYWRGTENDQRCIICISWEYIRLKTIDGVLSSITHFAVMTKPRTKITFNGCYRWISRLGRPEAQIIVHGAAWEMLPNSAFWKIMLTRKWGQCLPSVP